MKNSITIDILKYLKNYERKPINLKQIGFLSGQMFIKELDYNVNYDILTLKDKTSTTYLSINLNQIYKVTDLENNVCIYLDNDIKIKLY